MSEAGIWTLAGRLPMELSQAVLGPAMTTEADKTGTDFLPPQTCLTVITDNDGLLGVHALEQEFLNCKYCVVLNLEPF